MLGEVLRPLWGRLVGLTDQRVRDEPMPAGRLLCRKPIISPAHTNSIGVLYNSNWRRDVLLPAFAVHFCSTAGAASWRRR